MSNPVLVLPPITVTEAMLTDSNVPETDYAAWSSGATFGLEARCVYQHQVWQSLQSGNTNKVPGSEPDWWALVGVTNRWKAFDRSSTTQTANPLAISWTLQPVAGVTAIAGFKVTGALTVRVRVTHPTLGLLYDRTLNLARTPNRPGWWAWFFGEREAPDVFLLSDLPGLPGCTYQVDFTGTTALAVGILVLGQARRFGLGALQGARIGLIDYSRNETDEFGETTFVARGSAKSMQLDVPVPMQHAASVYRMFDGLRGRPLVVVGSPGVELTFLYGSLQELDAPLSYPDHAIFNLSFKGLT